MFYYLFTNCKSLVHYYRFYILVSWLIKFIKMGSKSSALIPAPLLRMLTSMTSFFQLPKCLFSHQFFAQNLMAFDNKLWITWMIRSSSSAEDFISVALNSTAIFLLIINCFTESRGIRYCLETSFFEEIISITLFQISLNFVNQNRLKRSDSEIILFFTVF
jgi:hypothetical protein